MTSLRRVTVGAGLLERTPPDALVRLPLRRLHELSEGERAAAAELAHWTFGAFAGAIYSAIPRALTRRLWSGPAYGIAIWLAFELVAPALRTGHALRHPLAGRAALALDHALYGAIVGRDVRRRAAAT